MHEFFGSSEESNIVLVISFVYSFIFFIFFHLFILLIPGFLILGAMQIKQINIPYSQEFII